MIANLADAKDEINRLVSEVKVARTERDALRAEGLQHKKDIITLIKERDKFKAEVKQLDKLLMSDAPDLRRLVKDLQAHNARLRGALERALTAWPTNNDGIPHWPNDYSQAAQALADSALGDKNPNHDPSKEM